MREKVCRQCRVPKPIDGFYTHPSAGDGRMAICKECHKANVRRNYRDNIEHYHAYERGRAMLPHRVEGREQYQRTEAGRTAITRARQRSDARYPERRAARIALGNAVRDGKVVKQPCEVCGNPKSHGHHDDYSKPLDVRWLCSTHHREHHRNEAMNQQESAA